MTHHRAIKSEIRYEFLRTKSSQEVVAFFNGSLSTLAAWAGYSDQLQKAGYSVLLHDFRGQGGSQITDEPISFDKHAEDIKDLLDSLDIRKIHTVAASYGTLAAIAFASSYPERVSSLILIDGLAHMDARTSSWVQRFIAWAKMARKSEDKLAFLKNLIPLLYSSEFIERSSEIMEKRCSKFAELPDEYFEGFQQIFKNQLANTPMTSFLRSIRAPSLIVWAEEDILTPRELSEELVDEIIGAEFIIIPRSGHISIVEKEKEIMTLILGFLAKQQFC